MQPKSEKSTSKIVKEPVKDTRFKTSDVTTTSDKSFREFNLSEDVQLVRP